MIFNSSLITWNLRETVSPTADSAQMTEPKITAESAPAQTRVKSIESAITGSENRSDSNQHVMVQEDAIWSEWLHLPYSLRQKRADIFIEKRAQVDFLPALYDFLQQKQFSILPYDDRKRYLPTDVLLLSQGQKIDAGTFCYLQSGKREIWSFLKQCFPNRL